MQLNDQASVSMKVLLLVFAVVLVGAFGYFVWQQNTAPGTTNNLANVLRGKATATTANETSGWKTYINTKYGFSYKYPPTWEIYESSEVPMPSSESEPWKNYLFYAGYKLLGAHADIGSVAVIDMVDLKATHPEDGLSGKYSFSEEATTFAGEPAVKITRAHTDNETGETSAPSSEYLVVKKGRTYVITGLNSELTTSEEGKDLQLTQEKLLESFKFTQ